jgi:MFS family permease
VSGSALVRVMSHRDFRLLWTGAFVSFTGSWIQNIAQGYFVFRLTGSEAKLAFVSFCTSVPFFLFAFVAGTMSDHFDKRRVLVLATVLLSFASFYMFTAIHFGFIQYWQIVVVALFIGMVGCVEIPTRQSIVSRVVPPEDLPAAVPVNAMTFNVARIFGPALGGVILAKLGVALCYLVNGFTFLAIIWAALAIRADLRPHKTEPQPIFDLIFEGARYTFKDRRLKALFFLEIVTAATGIAFMPLIPAYVQFVMGYGIETVVVGGVEVEIDRAKAVIAHCYTAIGIGALIGLLLVTQLASSDRKAAIIRTSMWMIGTGLIILSMTRTPWIVYPVLACVGAGTVAQFNTTNALFQLLSPDRLRGRVLAMHVWALNGLSPFGVLFFGWLANTSRVFREVRIGGWSFELPIIGVQLVMVLGGTSVLCGAIAALLSKQGLSNLRPEPREG